MKENENQLWDAWYRERVNGCTLNMFNNWSDFISSLFSSVQSLTLSIFGNRRFVDRLLIDIYRNVCICANNIYIYKRAAYIPFEMIWVSIGFFCCCCPLSRSRIQNVRNWMFSAKKGTKKTPDRLGKRAREAFKNWLTMETTETEEKKNKIKISETKTKNA